ncbi:MAG: hypothetical protein KKC51_11425 [Verrucomicrobia bacterium]|nr:hypothetical protein [Verrucomicrobiota bacterium]
MNTRIARTTVRIVFPYVLFAGLWILLSDLLLSVLAPDTPGLCASGAGPRCPRVRSGCDNLADSCVCPHAHEADGTPRFFLNAGVESLRGVKAEEALRDDGALHRQIDPAQRRALQAAEAAGVRSLTGFKMELR